MRWFNSIVPVKNAPTEVEQQQMRNTIDRLVGAQRRILVVPLLTSPSGGDPKLEQLLQGYSYEVAASGALSDARLVEWLLSRTAGQ
ncbi:MAG TPA: hypothetical protein VFT47_08770 [Vicinamibacterales bacterium]|nr:hypothetical protein [Vicinamibacterales bacterium]